MCVIKDTTFLPYREDIVAESVHSENTSTYYQLPKLKKLVDFQGSLSHYENRMKLF